MRLRKIFFRSVFLSFVSWYLLFSAGIPGVVGAQEPSAVPTESPLSSDVPSEFPSPTETPVATLSPTPTENPSPTASQEAESAVGLSKSPVPSNSPSATPISEASSEIPVEESADVSLLLTAPSPSSDPALVSENGENPKQENQTIVSSDQTSSQETTATSSADTGNNDLLAKVAEVVTGDAVAIASSINISNITLIGSNVFYVVQTVTGEESGEINLYDLFVALQLSGITSLPVDAFVEVNQNSTQDIETTAIASTGGNDIGAGMVSTGDALSVASSINLANFNLVGSEGLFAIFNMLGDFNGDIILPSFEGFESFPWDSLNIQSTQIASSDSVSSANADTGDNTLEGSGTIDTGSAKAYSNNVSIANIVRVGEGWGLIIINLIGTWDGRLVNWESPGVDTQIGGGTTILEKDLPGSISQMGGGDLTVINSQTADIASKTYAGSSTGENIIAGSGLVDTGDSIAVSNSFSFSNLLGVSSSFMVGIFNIVGNWFGNLVVAYPDLSVSITDNKDTVTPGEENNYTIEVKNGGKAWARGAFLKFTSPNVFIPGDSVSTWDLGNLAPGETKTVSIGGKMSDSLAFEGDIVAYAFVSGQGAEESDSNNNSSDTTRLELLQQENSESEADHTNPDLVVTISNNTGKFVYPGDTVIARIVVENKGPIIAKDVSVSGSLTNDHPMPAVPMDWSLGDLDPGRKRIIEFGISLIHNLPEGEYHLNAQAIGYNTAGDEVASSNANSSFYVKLAHFMSQIASPVNASGGEVLGLSTDNSTDAPQGYLARWKKYYPYVLLATLFLLLISSAAKNKLNGKSFLPIIPFKRKKKDKDSLQK